MEVTKKTKQRLKSCDTIFPMGDDRKTFKVGEKVVYPTHGVGIIDNITEKVLNGETVEYYVISIPSLDMNILLPLRNATDLGLRRLSGKAEIKRAIESLEEKKEIKGMDWKARQQNQMNMLNSGKIENVADVVNILYNRQKLRDLPIQERRLFEAALTHLIDEISCVLGLDEESAKRTIFSHLENIKTA